MKEYIFLVLSLYKNEPITEDEFEFLELNAGKLQMKCNTYGLGSGIYQRPYGLGTFSNYQFIANFPALFKELGMQDDVLYCLKLI